MLNNFSFVIVRLLYELTLGNYSTLGAIITERSALTPVVTDPSAEILRALGSLTPL